MDNIVGGRCSVSLITQLRRCIFSKNKNIFRHIKLEIALAIPAANEEQYNSNNSAGQGLSMFYVLIRLLFHLIDFISLYWSIDLLKTGMLNIFFR